VAQAGGMDVMTPRSPLATLRLLRHRATRPHAIIGAGLLVLVALFIYLPVWELISTAFTFSERDTRIARDAEVGAWTLFHAERVVSGPRGMAVLWRPLQNTLIVAFATTVIAVLLGASLAWFATRTDIRFQRWINNLALIPYMMPSWVNALAWLVIFKNERLGGAPGLLHSAFGWQPPNWLAYGIIPIIVALSLHYFIFAYLFVSNALQSVNAEIEEMAETLGANRWRILRRITFPIVLPAIGSAAILTLSRSLGTFGTPAFLGLPVGDYVLSTRIFALLSNRFFGEAFVLVIILVLLSLVSIYVNARLLGVRKSFVTVAGKGHATRQTSIGRWRTPVGLVYLLFLLVISVGPLIVLGLQTFMLRAGRFNLENFTLHYWIGRSDPTIANGIPGILRNHELWTSVQNSLQLAGSVALLSVAIGFLVGYVVTRRRGSVLARALEFSAFVPYILPGIAFGGIYLSLFSTPLGPLPALYGTFAILVIVCVAQNLTYSSQAGITSMLQLDRSLEEAAETFGASWRRRVGRILLPLTRGGLLVGGLLTFVTIMRELSLIILLVTPQTRTLTTLVFFYEDRGFVQHGNAVVLVLVTLVLAAGLAANRLRGPPGTRGSA
jgi:iron(III) transport system permease protein